MQEVIEKQNEKLQKTNEQLQEDSRRNRETNEKLQKEFEKLTKNPVPIGFIYVQLPKEKSPQEIWSIGEIKWTDVSSSYESIFFRVVGSKTETFGNIQEDFSPYIDKVSFYCQGDKKGVPCSYVTEAHIPRGGGWSGDLYTVMKFKGPGNDNESISFHFSGGEVRPRNMAVRVWKRTG